MNDPVRWTVACKTAPQKDSVWRSSVWNQTGEGETKVTQHIKIHQMGKHEETVAQSRDGSIVVASDSAETTPLNFNRHLYDNLLANLECQIEGWNRSAVRNPNPEIAHALWLKAEGLGYALRLLYAFEPEFRELVECASANAGRGSPISTC